MFKTGVCSTCRVDEDVVMKCVGRKGTLSVMQRRVDGTACGMSWRIGAGLFE